MGLNILESTRKHLVLNDFSPHTVKMYLIHTRKFLEYLQSRGINAEQYNREAISDYFLKVKEEGYAVKSRLLIKTIIIFLYKDVLGFKQIREDLEFIRLKVPEREVKSLSHTEAIKFINSVRSQEDKLIAKSLYMMGLRVSEVANLTIRNIKEKKVIGKGNKERGIFIPEELRGELLSFAGNRELIFSLKDRAIEKMIKRYAIYNGVDWVIPHTFRKSFTTNMINQGYSVQQVAKWLGHSSIETTNKHYTGKLEFIDKGSLYFK